MMALPLTALLTPTDCRGRRAPTVVALVGAGGKTSLLYALARLISASGKTVITTTTTHIRPPGPEQSSRLVLEPSPSPRALRSLLHDCRHLTLARGREKDIAKLGGFAPESIALFSEAADVILVEADGAAMRPLKAPAPHEPAVPPCAALCVAVLGLDGVGQPFCEVAHRPERAAALCATTPEMTVLPGHLSCLALHPEGLFRACAPEMERIVFCHKAELPHTRKAAVEAAVTARRQYPESSALWYMGSVREGWAARL